LDNCGWGNTGDRREGRAPSLSTCCKARESPSFDEVACVECAFDGRLIDPYGRGMDFVRAPVTDRCNLRCTYCMSKRKEILPAANY